MMTNSCLEPEIAGIIEMIARRSGKVSPEAEKGLRYMFCAREEYLDASYRRIGETYGSFENYIRKALHISDEEQSRLQSLYLSE